VKRLFLFRHGETDFNREHRFQGHLDIPLNDEGRRQAARLTRPLERLGCEEVLSSDLSRAAETALIAVRPLGLAVLRTSGLREAFLGDAQGLTAAELEERFGRPLVDRWRSPLLSDADVAYPGGETGNEVLRRVLATLEDHLVKTQSTRIGVATHGGVIRRVIRHLIGENHGTIPIPNGIVYTLEWSAADRKLLFVAESRFREKAGS
jgi:broad specificity phosphatase PhoE